MRKGLSSAYDTLQRWWCTLRDPGIHSARQRLLKLSTINTSAQTRTVLSMTGWEVNQYLQITGMILTIVLGMTLTQGTIFSFFFFFPGVVLCQLCYILLYYSTSVPFFCFRYVFTLYCSHHILMDYIDFGVIC